VNDDEYRIGRIYEGHCPKGHPMRIREPGDDHGWCDECGVGFSAGNGEVRVHIDAVVGDIDGQPFGPGTLTVWHREDA
jgi:hypothetical protein